MIIIKKAAPVVPVVEPVVEEKPPYKPPTESHTGVDQVYDAFGKPLMPGDPGWYKESLIKSEKGQENYVETWSSGYTSCTPQSECDLCGYIVIGVHKRNDILYCNRIILCPKCGRKCHMLFLPLGSRPLTRTPADFSCFKDPVIMANFRRNRAYAMVDVADDDDIDFADKRRRTQSKPAPKPVKAAPKAVDKPQQPVETGELKTVVRKMRFNIPD